MTPKIKHSRDKVKTDYWMFKAPLALKLQLDKIRIERIKKGKDMEMKPYRRLGLAIARHEQLLQDLINADMKEDRKI